MKHIYILEADPTLFGGIQQFVRNLAGYLPKEKVTLLAYYGKCAQQKEVPCPLQIIQYAGASQQMNWLSRFLSRAYQSSIPLLKNLALLLDIPRIRRNLEQLLNHDTLVLNSAFAMFFLCSAKVLKENRIILVQHTSPRLMKCREFDFGGIFHTAKIECFQKYVDTFVLLSPLEKKEFLHWLPFDQKKTQVIRHAIAFPAEIPEKYPRSVALLSRLVPVKRIDRAIAAAKLLPDVVFNIYGTGPEEQKLKKLAEGVPNVFFHGYTNDIDGVFRDNSMLLIVSNYEGYSISGIEACVHGRPVITLDTYPAACDLVENGSSGIVLSDYTPAALAAAIKQILAEPEKYRSGTLKHRDLYDMSTIKKAWQKLLACE